jgi:dGTPase
MSQNSIRHKIEQREKDTLSPHACLSVNSRGREVEEQPCPIRTSFQHDRDRILHCKSFRRLKHKTQVFLSPEGDHYRTRLTHTLEVSQIARTIARALSLNEDLTEAITLGHDLGHTPFGHAGERVLDSLLEGGFHHVRQSVRVVERLEKNGRGLNLTAEVRDGILCHSKGTGPVAACCGAGRAMTLEGQIVRFADIIAYVNHDLDDAIRGGVITAEDIPAPLRDYLGGSHSQRINAMVWDMITASQQGEAIVIGLSEPMLEQITALRDWLFTHVYRVPSVHDDFTKAARVLRELFEFFRENPQQMAKYGAVCLDGDPLEVSITDFLAGMTDRYAMKLYQEIFLPRPWGTL